MGDRTRDGSGRYEANHDVGDEEILSAMEPHEPDTSGELAEQLDIPRRTAYEYLSRLADEGRVNRKQPEPRRIIWWRMEDG